MPFDSQGGDTALIRAADGGRIECVCLLLERGADTEAVNTVRFLKIGFQIIFTVVFYFEHEFFRFSRNPCIMTDTDAFSCLFRRDIYANINISSETS